MTETAEAPIRDREFYERNLAAFEEHFPMLGQQLGRLQPSTRLMGDTESRDLNIDLGHTLFYQDNAADFAEAQLEGYFKQPSRFYLTAPDNPAPSWHHPYQLSDALYRYFGDRKISAFHSNATPDAGYMLIYGIGLGLHLPRLFEEMDVRCFVIVEEFPEFLQHSLWILDWSDMLDKLAAQGRKLFFFFGNEGRGLAGRVHWFMRGAHFGLLDGSYVYQHYQSPVLDTVHARFKEDLPLLPVSNGFFEDELFMLTQCSENLLRYPHYLLDRRPRLEKDVPAFIIGSGPSFDSCAEDLRRLRDRAVVFSCGTGLSVLLKHGIRPDFHCELENSYSSLDQLQRLRDRFGPLDGITLIASNTVHPDMPALFQRRIFFFRDSISASPMWCPDKEGLYGLAPTCTNLGVRASLLLGFRQLYLLGVDLGTRQADVHHSQASIYADDEDFNPPKHSSRDMVIEMPGNFGGKAYTNTILHWARMLMIQSLDPYPDARIYNCSDGIRITGTIPKLARTVQLPGPPEHRARAIDRLFGEMNFMERGALLDAEDVARLRAECTEWRDSFYALADTATAEDMAFVPFYEASELFVAETDERPHQGVLHSIYVGSLMMILQMGHFFYRRLPESERSPFMHAYIAALRERLALMHDDLDQTLATIEDKIAAHAAETLTTLSV